MAAFNGLQDAALHQGLCAGNRARFYTRGKGGGEGRGGGDKKLVFRGVSASVYFPKTGQIGLSDGGGGRGGGGRGGGKHRGVFPSCYVLSARLVSRKARPGVMGMSSQTVGTLNRHRRRDKTRLVSSRLVSSSLRKGKAVEGKKRHDRTAKEGFRERECVCVCVCERERERERGRGRETEDEG